MSAADNDGFVGKVGVVAFFNAGIKGVAIHVGDGQIEKFGVRYLARAATCGAAGATFKRGEAIFAQYRHGAKIRWAGPRHNG